MEVEISMKFDIIGGETIEYHYKLEDGQDAEFCELVQEARKKLCHKLKYAIENKCK